MEKDKNIVKELARELKRKAIRKYALVGLAVVILVSTVAGLNIEDKDSKLPDGQGNIITNEQVIDSSGEEQSNDEISTDADDQAKSPVQEKDESSNTQDSGNKDESPTLSTNKPLSDIGEKKPVEKDSTGNAKELDDEGSTEDTNKPVDKDSTEESKKPTAEDLAVDNSDDPTASNGGNSAYKPETAEPITVTISIRCDTLSNDMSKLAEPSIAEYVPTDGIILNTTVYKGTTDNTVFDVLNTVCRNNGIHMEASYTPMYESYYVEGINYLYEFDGGVGSGWMYKVNGWFPNYGCSSYYLSDGDVIQWLYTCDYGADIGGKVF